MATRARKGPVERTRWRDPEWVKLPDEQLLDLRFCDLGLDIVGTDLEERIQRLYDELAEKGIGFRPHCWLSTEWFSPDGVPGIAIPFYLAHPRLRRLEESQMLEVEGGSPKSCMRLLRHEAGHALDTAYRLHRRGTGAACSGSGERRTRSTTGPSPTASASCCTSTSGTRRATRPRTSPRRSRCGSIRARAGASATAAGRR